MAFCTPYLREPQWQAATTKLWQLPVKLRPWLLGRGSLTTQLVAASGGDFKVEVLSQSVAKVYASEARSLQLKPGQLALIREVILYGCGQPWVFARSVIPLSTLTGRLRSLRKLDNRPLGHHLFSYPSMRRSPIEVSLLTQRHRYLPERCSERQATDKLAAKTWARRSIFHLDDKPLLVSEVFLDSFQPA